MQMQTVLLIIAAFLLALGVAVFQYIKSKAGLKKRILLTGLRFLSLFCGLLLLINPEFVKNSYHLEKANLIVLADASSSIANLKASDDVKKIAEALSTDSRILERFSVHSYSFGKSVQSLDSLSFTERITDVSNALETVAETFSNAKNNIILVTDGNQTFGRDFEYFKVTEGSKLNAVVVGDTTSYQDVAIGLVNNNRFAFLDNQFPLEIQTVYSGKTGANTRLKVMMEGRVLYRESLTFSANKRSQLISTAIKANSTGIKTLSIEIEPLEGEKNTTNNIKEIAIEVIDERTRVGIISSINHPDIGALKKAIESNEQRKVVQLSPKATLKEFEEVDVFILYQPDESFNNLYDHLAERGGGMFTITGKKTNWNFLNNKLQNFYMDGFGQTEEIQPFKNESFELFDSSDFITGEYPPLDGELGELKFSKELEVVAYQKIKGVNLESPLFFIIEGDGNSKEAFLLGENIWKWRLKTYRNTNEFSSFDEFIGRLIFLLSNSSKKERLQLDYKNVYENASNAVVRASFFDKAYQFERNANFNLNLVGNNGLMKDMPMLLSGNQYLADLSDLEEGEYTFTVTETNERISKSGSFKILDFDVEQQFLSANYAKLQRLTKNNSGSLHFPDKPEKLLENLMNDGQFVPIQKSTRNVVSLIDFRIVLAIMVLVLALEWFIRKYNGLL